MLKWCENMGQKKTEQILSYHCSPAAVNEVEHDVLFSKLLSSVQPAQEIDPEWHGAKNNWGLHRAGATLKWKLPRVKLWNQCYWLDTPSYNLFHEFTKLILKLVRFLATIILTEGWCNFTPFTVKSLLISSLNLLSTDNLHPFSNFALQLKSLFSPWCLLVYVFIDSNHISSQSSFS